ncbi:MAG: peptidylprolyl isomerase, partial [Bacilli bacterium]|nr:peptidylprolyl isomerase [Bacilli bacterium]
MKKIFIIGGLVLLLLVSGCGKQHTEGKLDNVTYKETEEVTNYVKIEMKNGRLMILELYPDVAPITV